MSLRKQILTNYGLRQIINSRKMPLYPVDFKRDAFDMIIAKNIL